MIHVSEGEELPQSLKPFLTLDASISLPSSLASAARCRVKMGEFFFLLRYAHEQG